MNYRCFFLRILLQSLVGGFQQFPTSKTCLTMLGRMIPRHMEVSFSATGSPCSSPCAGPCALPCPAMASLWWRSRWMVGRWFPCAAAPNLRRSLRPFGCIIAWFPGATLRSIGWFNGKITGISHISWENLWFPVDFPLSQPIDTNDPKVMRDLWIWEDLVNMATGMRRADTLGYVQQLKWSPGRKS